MSDPELNKYILYIYDNINELKHNFRIEVLQMILYSNIDESKIVEKGGGSSIKFADMDAPLIKSIYNFIQTKMEYMPNY
jgi:hypothetical protein